jgi:hypothetical protein
VSGLSGNFSSKDICRLCHTQFGDLQDISGVPTAAPWTREEYDNEVENIPFSEFGVSKRCPFNTLKSFHCINGFPMDPLHDFLEKAAACDGASILMSLVDEGKITTDGYNNKLENVSMEGYEHCDRPKVVKSSCKKLPGKALAVAAHIRLMPYVLWQMGLENWLEDSECKEVLNLLLLLHRINEFIQADAISIVDIEDFEILWISYLDCRRLCKEKYKHFVNLTPKYHFIEHYATQMKNFGPLNCVWTARGEGKHRVFVNMVESAKNFVNLPKTLAIKHQKRLAYRYW